MLYTMQADSMSRFFAMTITDNGAPWTAPDGAAYTVRFGAPQMPAGWYDTITEPGGGTHPAVVVDENTVTVEIAEQAVSAPGQNILCVLVTDAQGYQIASWPFVLSVQGVPGFDAPEATVYYNALTAQVAQTLANAQAAASSATLSESWAVGGTGTRSGEDTNNAEYWAQQAQQVSQGALGWYETEQALQSAHPTGSNGQWAIVGSTDTIWMWDGDTNAWVDSGDQTDLSNYYTISQADAKFAVGTGGVANSAETATKLSLPVSIGSAAFDGSASVTLAQMGAQPVVNFSTSDEQPTGMTWIDGKPIYRKTVSCGALPNATTIRTPHGVTDQELMWVDLSASFAFESSTGTTIPIEFVDAFTLEVSIGCFVTSTEIAIRTASNRSSFDQSYITLLYTKTTD